MVFSSNWSQPTNSNHQLQESSSIVSGHGLVLNHPQLPQNPNPNHHHHHATSSSGLPARLGGGSMVEKARQAKLPPPEGTLNCPRCDSTNTKFCYYNNYNFTQPRYFCKGCRRYWTRGGTLRNVPVGGGCRKNNKKGKNGNSKSKQTSSSSSLGNTPSSSLGQIMNRANQQFLFQSQSHYNLTQLGGIGLNLSSSTNGNNQTHNNNNNNNIGSSLINELGFVNNNNENNNLMASVGSMSHQFTIFDPTTTGIYAFHNEGNIGISSSSGVDSRVYNQKDPVKMEEDKTNLSNLSKPENQYFWTGSDVSGPHFL